MLSLRQQKLLHLLMQAEEALTGAELASALQVTSRTIRSDVKILTDKLQANGAYIALKRGKGYELIIDDYKYFRSFLQRAVAGNEDDTIPADPSERMEYMLRRLLLSEDYIKIEHFVKELYISETSIKNGLKEVKKILRRFNLDLEKRPNYGLKIVGSEAKMRICMAEFVFHSDHQPYQVLPAHELEKIEEILLKHTKEASILLSDIGKSNLITHIAIACKRILDDNYVSMPEKELEAIMAEKEYSVAKLIVKDLQTSLGTAFPEAEVAYIAVHLLGTKIISYQPAAEINILDMIEKDILELSKKLLNEAEQVMQLGISTDEELIYGLCLHLKPAINRYKFGLSIRNPMLKEIIKNYPVAFDAAISMAEKLKQETGMEINQDEIGYIALHIGAAMERKKAKGKAKRCLIVCATGVASAQLLYHKLQATFGSKLQIVGTANVFDMHKYDLGSLDFIISTIPIQKRLTVPIIDVNTILRDEDIARLENLVIENIGSVLKYIRPELTFFQQDLKSKEEVLRFLCTNMERLEDIPDNFQELVEEREQIAPTGFGTMVAIPHPIRPVTKKTIWAVCTLKRPVQWGDSRVQFICLLSVQKEYKKDLQKMYQLLVKISGNAALVERLVKVSSYEEFVSILLSVEE
ncbi:MULTISPECIES: BglG family transcription antiterminator [Bacillaceae]|uniref:BglG family transcription antiterminator n=1 Tax=Bacillaceae TaxID=186817 RepID=UPI001E52CDA0|nr:MULTISPECIES: BglG family transcription antiterminator [Bacillaceae]MCE4049804.1 BglG family transcription antiterminator [Bacillus sp. Au-Bac7]MCM3032273.1 BglG family transcription antiterminator [Niallia sp. MER 6]MDL0435374.1 BglG family transcription antiterminator [Niallia sp. SS-2023]UPO87567.1 BglG family transcription antiterminator [Niallia sp. Man26]